MSSSLLEQELEQLQEQSEQVRKKKDGLKAELRRVEAEIERSSAEERRFEAVRAAVDAFDLLSERNANELFWEGAAEVRQAAALAERARGRLTRFEGEMNRLRERQTLLAEQIDQCLEELLFLEDEMRDAYDREARRDEEYVIEREISPLPVRDSVMPWSRDAESERRFRRTLLTALLVALLFGMLIKLLHVPAPVRPMVAAVPERLVSMLRREPPKPEPPKEEKKPEKEKEEKAEKGKEEQPKPPAPEVQAARKKAEKSGVLAFKDTFKDLVDEAPAAKLGAHAQLSQPAGQGRGGRSLVALPAGAGGTSGGIGGAGISRSIGPGEGSRMGGVSIARVQSADAEQAEEARPVSSGGPGGARTDEEIQIVFDKYKAALYRMYNTELRRNPTLRGRIILRITIEPVGEVSACSVQSNDLKSPELVAQIVERVKRFNFGAKDNINKTTILYPIDFLPGG